MTPDPKPGPLVAVDTSNWQKDITADVTRQWAAAGVNHAIVKMGGGNNGVYELNSHRPQVAAYRAAGIPASRYWFNGRDASIADQVTAVRAQLSATPLAALERFMWDVENEGSMARWSPAEVEQAAHALADLVPYSRQVVYLPSGATRAADWSRVVKLGPTLMVADYGPNTGTPSSAPLVGHWPREQVWLWQYTDQGRLPAYSSNLDLSTGNLNALWTVFDLQGALNKVMGTTLTRDGDKGAQTDMVLVAFQKRYGLKPDADAGILTLTKLAEVAG